MAVPAAIFWELERVLVALPVTLSSLDSLSGHGKVLTDARLLQIARSHKGPSLNSPLRSIDPGEEPPQKKLGGGKAHVGR